jgi:4-carboxymuconolactone decarboxylase
MTDSPLRAKGRAMRRNLMGAAYADRLDQQLYTDPIMEKFAALTQETLFGTLWTRRARPQDQDADLRRL